MRVTNKYKYIHFLEVTLMVVIIIDMKTYSSESRREDLVAGFSSSILTEAPSSMINIANMCIMLLHVFSVRKKSLNRIF